MRCLIKRIGDTFEFYVNENSKPLYIGGTRIKWFKELRTIYKNDNIVATIKPRIKFPLKVEYEISINRENESFHIKHNNSFTKPVFQCSYLNNIYNLILHKGNKVSIFRDNVQVAYYKSSRINLNSSRNIELFANSNCDKLLLFSLIFSIEYTEQDEANSVYFDLGNISGESKSFDEKWSPN